MVSLGNQVSEEEKDEEKSSFDLTRLRVGERTMFQLRYSLTGPFPSFLQPHLPL